MKFWPNKNSGTDTYGRQYVGDMETMDETISYHSKRIQPFRTSTVNQDDANIENYFIDEQIDYYLIEKNDKDEEIVTKNPKAVIVGRGSNFSYYFASFLKNFAEAGGFDILLEKASKCAEKLEKESSTELITLTLEVFELSLNYFHLNYLLEAAEKLFLIGKCFLLNTNNQGVKNVKKDILDIINKVLRVYSNRIAKLQVNNQVSSAKDANKDPASSSDPTTTNTSSTAVQQPAFNFSSAYDEIEQLTLSCSLKFLKQGSLDKRILSVKSIVEYIKVANINKSKLEQTFKLIRENEILNEIFGTNSHSQLVIKSQDLLSILFKEDQMTSEDIDLIWGFAAKADLEGKLMILKILKDLCRTMKNKHIQLLLNNIYCKNILSKKEPLINEEVEVRQKHLTHLIYIYIYTYIYIYI